MRVTGPDGKVTPHPQAQGPASLSLDEIQLLGDVSFLGVQPLPANAHHHIGVCFAIGVFRSQVGSLGRQYGVEMRETSNPRLPLLGLLSDLVKTGSYHGKFFHCKTLAERLDEVTYFLLIIEIQ